VALKFLERRDGKYHNTPATDLFLNKHKPSYFGGFLEMANQRLCSHWGNLTTALRTGQQQNESKGSADADVFSSLYADPARLKTFLKAMTGVSHGPNMALAQKFPWDKYRTAVDIGTAQGDLITQVVLANPQIRGIGFDLPEVGPIFDEYVEAHQLSASISFSPGSFFDGPLPQADVVMMGHILHDWDLDIKRMLIRKAYEALPEGGAYIVLECIIDDDRSTNAIGLMMSLNMLIETPGGFDFTGADCTGWMEEAGFQDIRVEHLEGPHSMVIGIK